MSELLLQKSKTDFRKHSFKRIGQFRVLATGKSKGRPQLDIPVSVCNKIKFPTSTQYRIEGGSEGRGKREIRYIYFIRLEKTVPKGHRDKGTVSPLSNKMNRLAVPGVKGLHDFTQKFVDIEMTKDGEFRMVIPTGTYPEILDHLVNGKIKLKGQSDMVKRAKKKNSDIGKLVVCHESDVGSNMDGHVGGYFNDRESAEVVVAEMLNDDPDEPVLVLEVVARRIGKRSVEVVDG